MTAVDIDFVRARVSTLVSDRWPGATVSRLQHLLGGRSSLTYLAHVDHATNGPSEIVVKMAPPGLAPTRNRDVLRQARVQRAVEQGGGVPIARVLFVEEGDPPQLPPLYAMEFLVGESFEPVMDECETLPAPDVIRREQIEAARVLGALHRLDPDAIGLGDEPEVPLEEELARWVRVFETVPDDLRTGWQPCADALLDALPAPLPSAVVHGEYRLGNMLARDGSIVAVIDWELWCREDPRIDLSWFLSYVDAEEQPSAIRATPPGMPNRTELLAEYETVLGRPVVDLEWFDAHARFKMAAIAALISKHNRRLEQPDPAQEARVPLIAKLIAQAAELVRTSK